MPEPLDHDDPSLPLPHGTDVVTRHARRVGDTEIAAGTAGRVVGSHGAQLDVQILGVGTVRFGRDEIAPFRAGQLQYALTREAAYRALAPNIVLRATVGSRAWGLAEADSDTDERGVMVLPFAWTARLGASPEELTSADGSAVYWEIGKVVVQALRADPNTLEMLFVPGARADDPLGSLLLAERAAFVSARIHASFGQYALSQLKKLRTALRLAEHKEVVLSWLAADPDLTLDAAAVRLAARTKLVAASEEAAVLRAKEYLKQLYASLFDQGLLGDKSFEALGRHARAGHRAPELPRRLRPKNAYNLLRLLITATGWLRTGEPEFEMSGEVRRELLAIKRGQTPLEDVLARAEQLSRALDEARRATVLPERPDLARAQHLLLRVREEAARRALAQEDGPFGRGAAPVPLPMWSS